MSYEQKYLKYKAKYLALSRGQNVESKKSQINTKQLGGGINSNIFTINELTETPNMFDTYGYEYNNKFTKLSGGTNSKKEKKHINDELNEANEANDQEFEAKQKGGHKTFKQESSSSSSLESSSNSELDELDSSSDILINSNSSSDV
jgi:hypothetical protein